MAITPKAFLLVLLTVSVSSSALAQSSKAPKPSGDSTQNHDRESKMDHSRKELTPLQARAIFLIGQLSDVARNLNNEASKIRIRSQIANVLWDYDEPQARKLFEDAFHEANSAFADEQKEHKVNSPPSFPGVSPQIQLLNGVLSLIAQRDRHWAESLSKSVTDIKLMGSQGTRSLLVLQIAMSIAETDPESSAQMALSSLDSGVNPMLVGVLHKLRRSNSSLADGIFNKALSVARRDPGNAFINIRILSLYVFPATEDESLEAAKSSAADTQVGAELVTKFLTFVYDAIMPQTAKRDAGAVDPAYAAYKPAFDYRTIYKLLPFFDQHMPDKAIAIRSQLREMGRSISSEQLNAITDSNIKDRIEELLRKADSAPLGMKDNLYTQAAMLASRNAYTDWALSIAENVSREARADITSIIHYQAAMKAIKKEDLDAAYHHVQAITIPGQCAIALCQIAQTLSEGKSNQQRAVETLTDGEQLLAKFDSGPGKAHALLEITNAMVKLDIDRGFDLMRSAVKAINQAEFSIDTIARGQQITPGLSAIDFGPSFSKLALSDFERALWLAQSIEMKDASILAQLAACRGVLATRAETARPNKDSINEKRSNKPSETKKPG